MSDDGSLNLIRTRAAVRSLVVPDWLAEVVRPRPTLLQWPQMIRATLAICVPLAVALALGKGKLGVLPATGGLLGTLADTGGPYLSRVSRVSSAAVFGGAAGLAIGSVTHGHGSRVANGIARRMVVPPHRDGGQAQYVIQPVAPSCDGTLRDLLEWLRGHLDQTLTVRQLAARANMSERTFARRFVQDTGTTPQRWLIGQRILLAQQLLEETDETVDAIADHTGFGNATALRHHFRAWRGTTPIAYRRLFRGDPARSRVHSPD
jgi:AraC-like DNA-binding protein